MVTARPTPDSDIKVEVWLPDAWNGKLLGTDNGGFSGAINYAALAAAVTKGYAAVSTDTGHTGDQMDFGIGHPEKIVDWAYRSVHEMTTIAKTVVERVKGRAPARSYFSGCSTGGQQALSEAQRYPADYDGIVGGDPGNNRINLDLRVSLVMARHARHGRNSDPSERQAAGAGEGRSRGV